VQFVTKAQLMQIHPSEEEEEENGDDNSLLWRNEGDEKSKKHLPGLIQNIIRIFMSNFIRKS